MRTQGAFSSFLCVARDLNDPGEKGWRKVFEQGGLRPIGARTGAADAQKLTTSALV